MIPNHIIRRAVDRIVSQGPTPRSPCALDDGGVRLCAAAAVATAAVEHADGVDSASAFVRRLGATRDMELVRAVFDRFGWGRGAADMQLRFNDACHDDERQPAVAAFLATWAAPTAD